MDIRRPLLVGQDDNLVHQTDEFIVGSRRYFVMGIIALFRIAHAGQQVIHRAHVRNCAKKLVLRSSKLTLRGHAKLDGMLGENVIDQPRHLQALGIRRHENDTFGGFFKREPVIAVDVLALDVSQQIKRLDPLLPERLVRYAKEAPEHAADC